MEPVGLEPPTSVCDHVGIDSNFVEGFRRRVADATAPADPTTPYGAKRSRRTEAAGDRSGRRPGAQGETPASSHSASHGVRGAPCRDLAPADVVPMHRTRSVGPRTASAARPRARRKRPYGEPELVIEHTFARSWCRRSTPAPVAFGKGAFIRRNGAIVARR